MRPATLAAVLGLGLALAPGAQAAFAPIDQPGPALSPPAAELEASVACTPDVKGATREPVLLLPATGVNSDQNYAYNYERAFKAAGVPYCTSDVPGKTDGGNANMADIQRRGEFVTFAIRRTHELAGRKIAVLGHSQGGMVMRWSLRFWPDTRAMVQDVIGMAGSNHGTTGADNLCQTRACTPAEWQQRSISAFTAALNSFQETFAGIDYTEIYTHDEEVVTPNQDARTGSSSLRTGPAAVANVAVQDLCPLDPSDHLNVGTGDAVAYALVVDALTHDGPADPKRIDPTVCAHAFQPGVDPATFPADSAASSSALALAFTTSPTVGAEPPLACYATATCAPSTGGGGQTPGTGTTTCRSLRHFTVRLDRAAGRRLSGVTATLAGQALTTHRSQGRTVVDVDLRGRGRGEVVLRVRGRDSRGRARTVLHRYHPCVPGSHA